MSDTPKTDKACGWPMGHHGHIESSDLVMDIAGPFVHSSVARELERENAALRAEVKVTRQNYESFKADNIGLCAAIAESEEFARKNGEMLVSKARELLAENAALREQVEHLIGMIEQLEGDLAHFATIEAFEAKKEAQP